ncbi:MAG: hypothetical protein WCC48_08555 [Anaeromyxobacteraceae bacterium]
MSEMGEATAAPKPGKAAATKGEKPKSKAELRFDVRFYGTYETFTWQPFHDRDPKKYGEIRDERGGTNGDRATTLPMLDGYVYVIKDKALLSAWAVTKGAYQRVEVTPSDTSHSRAVGEPGPFMTIEGFFPKDDAAFSAEHFVVASAFRLSKRRLFDSPHAITKKPEARGKRVSSSRRRLRDAALDKRSGPQIFADYQNGKSSPDLITYDYLLAPFGGAEGFHLLLPDVAGEARRRSARYRQRLGAYKGWEYDDRRSEEAFVHQAIYSVMQQKPSARSEVDRGRFDAWQRDDVEQYRRRFFPVQFAAESLVQWLEHPAFLALLADHSQGIDTDQEAGVALYGETIADLHYTPEGVRYLGKQYDDEKSYFHQTTKLLALRPGYQDPGGGENLFFEIRKWSNVVYAALEEFAAVIAVKEGKEALTLVITLLDKQSGMKLARLEVQPVEYVARRVTVVDLRQALDQLGKWPETKSGRGVVTFIEGFNVALAFRGWMEAESGEATAKNTTNLAGSVLDFLSSNWLFKSACTRLAANRKDLLGKVAGRAGPVLGIASGIIDAFLALWEMKAAYQRGDYDVMVGWAVVAVGGVLVAVGWKMVLAGAKAATSTAGVAAKPGGAVVVAGLIVEGIGLLLVWVLNNDELEDWIDRSEFGRKPAGKPLTQQIQELNDILCRFEVEADFKDVDFRYENHTAVTLKVKPRAITDRSQIRLTGLCGIAKARKAELINPFSTVRDLQEGMQGGGDVVLELEKLPPTAITRKDGRITEVRTTLQFRMDIDELKGRAQLDLNDGTKQGYARDFVVEA